MKRFYTSIQGITCFVIAAVVFWFSAPLVQSLDSSAGVWDRGSLHGLALGSCAYLLAVWLAWLVLQIEWPSLNKHIDESKWLQDWRALTPAARVWYIGAIWTSLFYGALICILSWK